MVTCKLLDTVAVSKMNSMRTRKPSSSNSSGFRLLDGDHLDAASSVSKNSVYKLKIDLLFDDTRSIRSNRLDDPRGSHRTRSIIMYGRSELASTAGESGRSITSLLEESTEASHVLSRSTKKDVQRVSNTVQAQIEQLFTDVAKDATSSFTVMYLGSLPLKDKVTSLQGLQEPLRELYLNEMIVEKKNKGILDICGTGLRVKINSDLSVGSSSGSDENITPFHNIAVWSAVKFVMSDSDDGAAFLPLITDPDNIDKTSLFRPLSPAERRRASSNSHAPIFAVVMRSAGLPKVLECHAFICKSTEDAIVIAATLYQSLMAHVSSNSHRSTKRRTPRTQNGVSCISIASSSARTASNYLSRSQVVSNGRKSSFRSSNESVGTGAATSSRLGRKKRGSNNSLSSSSNVINEAVETTTEERKRKSHKTKRAPPVPIALTSGSVRSSSCRVAQSFNEDFQKAYLSKASGSGSSYKSSHRSHHHGRRSADSVYKASEIVGVGIPPAVVAAAAAATPGSVLRSETNGDILTRVAIPRSGSFLNTGGLTRYKSRGARRHNDKLGGGGGSPLGFSELFNEFRLHENLHSLDEILYAIIDADGMSFNDLKPIYKEFLLKLAVTLTKDELFQRSKNIMRRQKKKKLKRRNISAATQKKSRTLTFGTKSLKKVFQLGQFRSCRGKPPKQTRNKEIENQKTGATLMNQSSGNATGNQAETHNHQQQRARIATSGSDVSVVRHDNMFHGLNRNSSSGYVSCSECSYDSETCTCTSADRCYCSLRSDHISSRLRRKNEHNVAASKTSSCKGKDGKQFNYASNSHPNRHSLISCKSDEKCYCSMVEEEEPIAPPGDDSVNTHSDTTWCDTDSCVSASKCYCKRSGQAATGAMDPGSETSWQRQLHSAKRTASEKLALDYELFTINGNGKSVQPHEALSVKKSVEAAAIFADVKLSQTTDIKSICPPLPPPLTKAKTSLSMRSGRSEGSCRSQNSSRKHSQSSKKRDTFSIDRRYDHQNVGRLSSSSSQKSCSADDLLGKLNAIEKTDRAASVKYTAQSKNRGANPHLEKKESIHSNYHSMRVVSASLEDTLGYLP